MGIPETQNENFEMNQDFFEWNDHTFNASDIKTIDRLLAFETNDRIKMNESISRLISASCVTGEVSGDAGGSWLYSWSINSATAAAIKQAFSSPAKSTEDLQNEWIAWREDFEKRNSKGQQQWEQRLQALEEKRHQENLEQSKTGNYIAWIALAVAGLALLVSVANWLF